MAWTDKDKDTLQVFAGGRAPLDSYAKTMGMACGCDGFAIEAPDRLTNPLQFDRGLNHLSPSGGRETFHFGAHQQAQVNREIIDFINTVGVGAKIEIIAIPNFSIITALALSVYQMPAGMVLKFFTRNGAALPGIGTKVQVPIAGGCKPVITKATAALSALNTIAAQAAANKSEHYIYVGDNNATTAAMTIDSDALTAQVVSMPTAGLAGHELFIDVDVSYDTVLRLPARG